MSRAAAKLLVLTCLVAPLLSAADDPFVGKWKLNPDKSTLTDEMKVEALGGNKYALDLGGGTPETVVADGTDQPGIMGTTLAVTAQGPNAWTVVRKRDGRTLVTGDWKLSDDGKTLTDHFTANQADGSTFRLDYVYERTAGASGFAGTWDSSSEKVNSPFELQIGPYDGDGLSFSNEAQKTIQNMKFDGKDYVTVGPNVPADLATSGRRVNDHALELTDKLKDKAVDTQNIEVSADLKTLTLTVHKVGQSKPNILVFDRQ